MKQKRLRVVLLIAACVAGCAVCGCRSKSTFQFDGLDMLPPEEELKEFPLGQYKIPIPIVDDRGQNKPTRRNRYEFDFTLYALVLPKEKSQMEEAWGRHEGQIRDEVMNVCRSASVV